VGESKATQKVDNATEPTRLQRLWQQVREIAVLVLIIFTIKGCIIDQYSIPSGSMEPTLHGDANMFKGDRVLTNKMLFGPRIPFTTIRLWNWWEPQRWDIVVFKPPAGGSEHPRLIKRVVGLPGERVQIKEGRIFINGEPVPFGETMPKDFRGYWGYEDIRRKIQEAPLPEQRQALAMMLEQYPPKYGCLPDDEYQVVPEGHYLMLGDNSLNSVDGRMFGWVPRDHLYGRASAVIWPIRHWRDFTGFSHTWWGKLLLYGIPLAIVGFEVHHWRKERQMKKARATAARGK
jgi:signal peptidase I